MYSDFVIHYHGLLSHSALVMYFEFIFKTEIAYRRKKKKNPQQFKNFK